MDILMNSGFATIVEDLERLVTAGRISALNPESVAHMLNGAVMAQVLWLADADRPDPARLRAAHAVLDAVFDGLSAG